MTKSPCWCQTCGAERGRGRCWRCYERLTLEQLKRAAMGQRARAKADVRTLVKQIVEKSGRSESWLRSHVCAWCEQTILERLRGNCGAMYEKCDCSMPRSAAIESIKEGKP